MPLVSVPGDGKGPIYVPYDGAIPGATGQLNANLLAKTAYQNTLARINRQRGQTLQQYGYKGEVDPTTGVIKHVAVDPFNQYGDFQTMLRNHAGQAQQAEWAAQDRGLRGGLANKAQSDLHYNFGQQSAQLGTNFGNQFTDYQDQQTQAKYEYDRALWEAQQAAAAQAIADGAFNPAPYGDTGGGDAGVSNPNSDGYAPYVDPFAMTQGEADMRGISGGSPPKSAKAKPSPARVAKTAAKLRAGWKQVK